MFLNETVRNTVGGAFLLKNLNTGGVSLFNKCTFYNNFGDNGGAIYADKGGNLFCLDNHFSNDISYLKINQGMQEILDSRAEVEAKLIDNKIDANKEDETSGAGNQDSSEGRLLQ